MKWGTCRCKLSDRSPSRSEPRCIPCNDTGYSTSILQTRMDHVRGSFHPFLPCTGSRLLRTSTLPRILYRGSSSCIFQTRYPISRLRIPVPFQTRIVVSTPPLTIYPFHTARQRIRSVWPKSVFKQLPVFASHIYYSNAYYTNTLIDLSSLPLMI